MACGILTVTRQKHYTVIMSPSVLNRDGLINPESHLCKDKLRDGAKTHLSVISPALALN